MNKILFNLLALLLTSSLWAQNLEHITCQAIVYKSNGEFVKNELVAMQVSIWNDIEDHLPCHIEKQSVLTNDYGLVTIELGNASEKNNPIDLCKGVFFISIETNPALCVSVISKLNTVDSAVCSKQLYRCNELDPLFKASVASNIMATDTIKWNNKLNDYIETDPLFEASTASGIKAADTLKWNGKQDELTAGIGIAITENTIRTKYNFYLGQDTLGGIVFYIYTGRDQKQHGLIVSKIEGSLLKWQNTSTAINVTRSWDGAYNTNLLSDSPAKDWINNNCPTGWYLPSIDELSLLWNNRFHVNRGLNNSRATLLSNTIGYWSSTEGNETHALSMSLDYGVAYLGKTNVYSVRAIRTF